ncbi:MAG TPA: class I SAM-dependent methyltransferase [Bacillales bacterium]|nr:class I SAM-dependent methyltransferase [Bacillales bacterium]
MKRWFPKLYDPLMASLETKTFKPIRTRLIGDAGGQVLEIGAGTGVNFAFYKMAEQVTAIEPNPEMLKRAQPKKRQASVAIHAELGNAEQLNFPENAFDTVVGTLVFCTIANPEKALDEIRRVLNPGGRLLLLEHVRMEDRLLGKAQDLLTPVWRRLCDGCHLNRNTLRVVKEAGFREEHVESFSRGLYFSGVFLNQP